MLDEHPDIGLRIELDVLKILLLEEHHELIERPIYVIDIINGSGIVEGIIC